MYRLTILGFQSLTQLSPTSNSSYSTLLSTSRVLMASARPVNIQCSSTYITHCTTHVACAVYKEQHALITLLILERASYFKDRISINCLNVNSYKLYFNNDKSKCIVKMQACHMVNCPHVFTIYNRHQLTLKRKFRLISGTYHCYYDCQLPKVSFKQGMLYKHHLPLTWKYANCIFDMIFLKIYRFRFITRKTLFSTLRTYTLYLDPNFSRVVKKRPQQATCVPL